MDTARTVLRVQSDGTSEVVTERIAREAPWTIRLNGAELVTLILSPEDLEDLVVGYLANEGLIVHADDISTLIVDDEESQIWVRVPTLRVDPAALGRRLLTSCCGRGRPGLYFLNDGSIKPVAHSATMAADAVLGLVAALDGAPGPFRDTGGVHSAALAKAGALLQVRADVGRHNALDKIAGWMLRNRVDPDGAALVCSGRISAEMVVKTARMRVGFLLSNAAPTSLGQDLAEELGITAAGFVRHGRFNVYAHPERIQLRA
ncbi:MAG: formate dehydrogenase accessory sulfurtransferase FdhD [Clostridia bacterium]